MAGYQILKGWYSSKDFAKLRFWQHRQKQKFKVMYTNKAMRLLKEEAGEGNDYVVTYGNCKFPLTMKCVGSLAHERLMRLLSKKVRIVMTSEYRTTNAFPKC